MKNVLVIGGAGFIGGHLVEALLARPEVEHVTVADRAVINQTVAGKLERICCDASDLEAITRCARGHDTVFHLASNADISRAATEPTIDFHAGTVLTHNALEAARNAGVERFIYFSGSGVYGDQGEYLLGEDFGSKEPVSTYGASKLGGEALCCAYAHMFGIQCRAFRFANVVGPRQTHGVGLDFVRKLRADPTRLTILGDGKQTKSYIHVDDVVRAVMAVVDRHSAKWFDVFNVATDDFLTVEQIAILAVEACGLKDRHVKFEYTGGPLGWKGDVPVVRLDSFKIRRVGWQPMRSSEQAMRDALRWMAEYAQ